MFLIGKQNENVFRNIVLMTDTVNFWFSTFWQVIYGKLRILMHNAPLRITFKCSATGITAQASFQTGQSIWKWNIKVQLSLKQPEQDDVLLMILSIMLFSHVKRMYNVSSVHSQFCLREKLKFLSFRPER